MEQSINTKWKCFLFPTVEFSKSCRLGLRTILATVQSWKLDSNAITYSRFLKDKSVCGDLQLHAALSVSKTGSSVVPGAVVVCLVVEYQYLNRSGRIYSTQLPWKPFLCGLISSEKQLFANVWKCLLSDLWWQTKNTYLCVCVCGHDQNRCPNKVLVTRSSALCCSYVLDPCGLTHPSAPCSFQSMVIAVCLSVCLQVSLAPSVCGQMCVVSSCTDEPAPNTACTIASIFFFVVAVGCEWWRLISPVLTDRQAVDGQTGKAVRQVDSVLPAAAFRNLVPSVSITDGQLVRMEQL